MMKEYVPGGLTWVDWTWTASETMKVLQHHQDSLKVKTEDEFYTMQNWLFMQKMVSDFIHLASVYSSF